MELLTFNLVAILKHRQEIHAKSLGMALPNRVAVLILFVSAMLAMPKFALANEFCNVVNTIIASGQDENQFASIDTLVLPDAWDCRIEDKEYSGIKAYQCSWGLNLEEMRKIDSYRADIRYKLRALEDDFLDNILEDEVYAAGVKSLIAEVESKFSSIIGVSVHDVAQKNREHYSSLYQNLYKCFDSGAIPKSEEYEFSKESSFKHIWHHFSGCYIEISESEKKKAVKGTILYYDDDDYEFIERTVRYSPPDLFGGIEFQIGCRQVHPKNSPIVRIGIQDGCDDGQDISYRVFAYSDDSSEYVESWPNWGQYYTTPGLLSPKIYHDVPCGAGVDRICLGAKGPKPELYWGVGFDGEHNGSEYALSFCQACPLSGESIEHNSRLTCPKN